MRFQRPTSFSRPDSLRTTSAADTARSRRGRRSLEVEALEQRMLLSGTEPRTLIDDSTPGFYNSALGTMLDDTQIQFPCADVACGDPRLEPASEPNLSAAAGVLGNWLAPVPFPLNSNWSDSPVPILSDWELNTENAIIYPIDAGPYGLVNIKGHFGVDNGIFVWVNGVYKFGAEAPGGAGLEYSPVDLGNLHPGLNFIQILREDHGQYTGYTSLITHEGSINTPPVAGNDRYPDGFATPSLNVYAPGVLGNDIDIQRDPLTAVLVSGTRNGTVELQTDGSFYYTPNPDFCGVDTFTYLANDGSLDSNPATVAITVTGYTGDDCSVTNVPPVASDDTYDVVNAGKLAVPAPGVLDNDTDMNGDRLTAELVLRPIHGTVVLQTNGSFTYEPKPGFCGADSFTYHANDRTARSNVATVSLRMRCANSAPIANDDNFTIAANTMLVARDCPPGAVCVAVVRPPGLLRNDSDPDGDLLTARLISAPTHGRLNLATDGAFTYMPDCGFTGSDSFTYRANDGSLDSKLATATITVTEAIPGFSFRDGCLSITGTRGPDSIRLVRVRKGFQVQSNLGTFDIPLQQTLQSVVVRTLGGDDTVQLSALRPGQAAKVDGGDGNDHITGGSGRNLLLGGPGDDFLIGGKGGNVLFGGTGADHLLGSTGIDLLIADVLDDRDGRLDAGSLLQAWLAANNPTARQAVVQQLIDHVADDGALDGLTGGRAADLFVAGSMDIVFDRSPNDLLVRV